MHGPFEGARNGKPNIYQNWSMKLVALPLLLLIALIGYIVSHPNIASWVADGVEAEFVGTNASPDLVAAKRLAEPGDASRAVAAH